MANNHRAFENRMLVYLRQIHLTQRLFSSNRPSLQHRFAGRNKRSWIRLKNYSQTGDWTIRKSALCMIFSGFNGELLHHGCHRWRYVFQ